MKATMRCVDIKVCYGGLGVPYFSILCPENIGSAKKLSLACQEEFGVGAPSFLQAGIGERKKANQVSSRQALEEKKQEYLWLDSWQYLHSTNVSGYRYMSVQSKDLGAVFFGNANTCRNYTGDTNGTKNCIM